MFTDPTSIDCHLNNFVLIILYLFLILDTFNFKPKKLNLTEKSIDILDYGCIGCLHVVYLINIHNSAYHINIGWAVMAKMTLVTQHTNTQCQLCCDQKFMFAEKQYNPHTLSTT